MALPDALYSSLSVSSAVLLLLTFPSSAAQDRPLHSAVIALAGTALLLLSTGRLIPTAFQAAPQRQDYEALPLEDRGPVRRSRSSQRAIQGASAIPAPVSSKLLLTGAIVALSIRLEFYRRIAGATECTIESVEVFLPLMLAIHDVIRSHSQPSNKSSGAAARNQTDSAPTGLRQLLLLPLDRYIPSAVGVCTGSYLALDLWAGLNSSYICPLVGGQTTTVPLMQWLSVVLDCFAIIALYELSEPGNGRRDAARATTPFLWASILTATVGVWIAIAVVVYLAKPELRQWLLLFDVLFDSVDFILALFWQTFLFSVFCVATACWALNKGLVEPSMGLTVLLVMVPALRLVWTTRDPYPPLTVIGIIAPFIIIYLAWWAYERRRQFLGLADRRTVTKQVLGVLVLLVLIWLGWTRTQSILLHPVDVLIDDARTEHKQYASLAFSSASLGDAVEQYRLRYKFHPPPDFDVWYQYAINRSSIIIDEYDQIFQDLQPFWAIPPADLRRQTWEMVSNPWNEISGITIRGGIATVQENVLPTHRWMLEGVAVLINSFAQYLPDMDLAFNLNDESRVAVPFSTLMQARELAEAMAVRKPNPGSWSANRSESWLPIPESGYTESVFQDLSFRNTFSKFGSVGCSPSSRARKYPHSNSRSHICLDCTTPHSKGQFLANWTLAADVCHQPDLAHLHGFYLSPAAFKTSYEIMPVFSQSKPHGFNDILYPSAWNYMDKAVYAPSPPSGTPGAEDYNAGFPDPSFTEKQNTLFWRGATSEGVSSGDHAWRGMTRQRLVHMASNLTNTGHDRVTLLLPESSAGRGRLRYQTIRGTELKSLGLRTDIAIVDHIARCGGIGLHDCKDQDAEFGLVLAAGFQSHWQYRYLFDLDGAGFSGRFLPFLHSRCLPFKTALFREWYDSRLTAWRHFVPQDLRLHGLWSTLAYFAGVEGKANGKEVRMQAHLEEGEMIANAGRDWAAKVLRKEDMEIYFFRLLLEWGRLTDDRRDEIGFSMQSG